MELTQCTQTLLKLLLFIGCGLFSNPYSSCLVSSTTLSPTNSTLLTTPSATAGKPSMIGTYTSLPTMSTSFNVQNTAQQSSMSQSAMSTEQPSMNPTKTPTEQPSMSPSSMATEQPSMNPSLMPTKQPSMNPSLMPTSSPTNEPTSSSDDSIESFDDMSSTSSSSDDSFDDISSSSVDSSSSDNMIDSFDGMANSSQPTRSTVNAPPTITPTASPSLSCGFPMEVCSKNSDCCSGKCKKMRPGPGPKECR
mmetsp:Transcript_10823/g.14049  ORF Transcript_10823/g.14049 Transcript_10823/m.14049 type:complete len:250 (-) Transcript_10823:161-910(-)